jgi:hypothetical protein
MKLPVHPRWALSRISPRFAGVLSTDCPPRSEDDRLSGALGALQRRMDKAVSASLPCLTDAGAGRLRSRAGGRSSRPSSSERRPGPGSCSHTGSRRGTLRLASCRTPAGASVSPAFAATRAHTPNADCWRGRGLCLKVIGAPPEQLVGPAGPRPPTLSAVSRVVRLGRACPHRSKRRLDPGQILSKRLIFERAVWEHGDVTRVAVSGCAPARRAPVPVDRLASRG